MTSQVTPCFARVVSPEFPCGAAWLANALLELDVALPELWGTDTAAEWEAERDGRHRYVARHLPWRQTLASLRVDRRFRFRRDIRVGFSHTQPWHHYTAAQTVLVTRDPRDALHSEWQRHRRILGVTDPFEVFARKPFFGGPISVVDMLWLHLHAWQGERQRAPERHGLLRFEDWKRAPLDVLGETVRWLGIDATDADVARAAEASEVGHLLDIEQALAAADPTTRRLNRRGRPDEWREVWQPAWSEVMGAHWQPLLAGLGYAPLDATGPSVPCFDAVTVLRWRGIDDADRLRHWLDRLGL